MCIIYVILPFLFFYNRPFLELKVERFGKRRREEKGKKNIEK
jgi:hypothetical protein